MNHQHDSLSKIMSHNYDSFSRIMINYDSVIEL